MCHRLTGEVEVRAYIYCQSILISSLARVLLMLQAPDIDKCSRIYRAQQSVDAVEKLRREIHFIYFGTIILILKQRKKKLRKRCLKY